MKSKFLFILLLIGVSHSLLTYPIIPRPLRKLVIESRFIVYAEVIAIKNIKTKDHWEDTKAILVIKEILQGNIKQDTIEVFFTPGMICPAPAYYEKGTNVLAFLDKQKKGYSTHALSYGAKTLDEAAYQVYKSRIIEMQQIITIADEKQKRDKTIEWLISCAINPHTRWEGIYELSPESDFMSFYDRDQETFIRKYHLTERQRSALRTAFLGIDQLSYSDMGMIDLVADRDDKELLDFLIGKFKQSEIEKMWFKDFLMSRIAELSHRDDLRNIVRQMEELDYMDEKREEKANALAKQFMNRL